MQHILSKLQRIRNFDPDIYLEKKLKLINQFFIEHNLDSAVIGLSGGLDSSVSLLLLKKASEQKGSPIKKIIAVIAPIVDSVTTHQVEATARAVELVREHHIESNLVDLTEPFHLIIKRTNPTFVHGIKIINADENANSKLAALMRTSLFYYHREILKSIKMNAVVVGTLNRDDGSYIGNFEKSTDIVSDVQLVADLHKSELVKLGTLLNIDESIISKPPNRDDFRNKTDEELLGVPYWFIEMYLLIKDHGIGDDDIFRKQEKEEYKKYSTIIESLHEKNKHKYENPLNCYFLDIMTRKIEGGW